MLDMDPVSSSVRFMGWAPPCAYAPPPPPPTRLLQRRRASAADRLEHAWLKPDNEDLEYEQLITSFREQLAGCGGSGGEASAAAGGPAPMTESDRGSSVGPPDAGASHPTH